MNRAPLWPCLLVAGVALCVPVCSAQQSNFTDYSQAYKKNLSTNPGMAFDSSRYLYNRYFRNSPGVSPYLSGAVLGGNDAGTAYTAVVRPDLQRREAARVSQAKAVQRRKMQGNVGYTAHPGAGYLGAMPGSGLPKPNMAKSYRPQPYRSQPNRPQPNRPKGGKVGAYQNHWYGGWQR